ncbi:MAG TPA: MBL fold metallo-hydrolase [Gammaproteobacteria bacterium]|nr:MBL fold metallo-hydrolase [Gammaproteobacteria bacterium]
MNRRRVSTFSSLLFALTLLAPLAVRAQGQPDFSQVQIKTTKLAGNLYTLEGQGGTIGVLAGPDGVFMVDSQFAPLSEKIAAAIKQISDRPIRFLVNTHVHGDHTGGNDNFGKMGVTILARENLRNRLEHPNPGANGQPGVPMAPAGLPVITYDAPLTLRLNGEEIRLIPAPKAHTDGDTFVQFVNANVIMTGDFYRSIQFPNIDRASGGSLPGLIDALNAVIALAGPATKIVPGHGPVVDRTAVAAHRDMVIAIRDKVAKLVKEGKTQEEVVAAKPTADYDAKVQQPGTTADRFVGQLYAELKQ